MADVAMGNLRFDLTADNSQFMAAVKQAKEAQTQAASEMGSKFADASQKAQQSLMQMAEAAGTKIVELIKKLQQIGKSVGEAVAGGADGVEAFSKKLFENAIGMAESWTKKLLASVPFAGKFLSTVYELAEASGAVKWAWDNIGKSVAGALDGLLSKAKPVLAAIGSTYVDAYAAAASAASNAGFQAGLFDEATLKKQEEAVKLWAENIKKTFADLYEGLQTMLQKMAGTFNGVGEAVKTAVGALKERTSSEAFQTSLLGLDRGARTEAIERAQVLKDIGKEYDELNEKEKKLVETELQNRIDAANDFEMRQKELEQTRQREQAVTSLTAAIKRQADMALANAGRANGAKSAFDRAMDQSSAMSEGYGRGRNAGLLDDPRVAAARQDAARKAQEAADFSYRAEQSRMLREANDKGFLEQSSLGSTPGATEKLRVEMELMNKARREGVTLDANQLSLNASIAESMGKIAQATAEARERFQAFREVGQTVASSLEDAFGKFMNGTRVGWKEFIGDLEKDLARLAFKKGIEGILTGTATGGGGLFGALAGLISGARAEGGPVSAGGRYIVGERGPEMFVPQSAGSIVPNHAMGGGGATTINMRIDLAGANGDEAIARISAQAARQAAMQAVQASNDAFPQRQRSLQLLGA